MGIPEILFFTLRFHPVLSLAELQIPSISSLPPGLDSEAHQSEQSHIGRHVPGNSS